MIELEEEVREIKKEIVESRNLVIRMDNSVKNLSADIKQIQKKQESYERKYIFTSVVAYLIFVAIIGTGAFFLVQARSERLKAENQELLSKNSGLNTKVTEVSQQLALRDEASKAALRVYNKLKSGISPDAIAEFDRIKGRGVTQLEQVLLDDLVGRKRVDVARVEYEEARRAYNRRDYEKAEESYRRAETHLGIQKDKLLTDIYYELGTTLHKVKKYAESTAYLQKLIERSEDPQRNGEATYLIAANYELSAQPEKAKEHYLKFMNNFPKHKWVKQAKVRWRKLQ
jgi:tetratricopeptide (TPR) repeat protein